LRNARVLLLVVFLFQPLVALQADGGAVRFSERRGDYRITVFTSPTPLRAGQVDVSVFVQDTATGEPVADAQIAVRALARERPEAAIEQRATTDAATNKLFQAAHFDLPEAGWWDVTIIVEGLREPIEVYFEMEADQPLPRVWEMTLWIAWPAVVVVVFFVHKWLVQRKQRGSQRKKEASSPRGEPALVTFVAQSNVTVSKMHDCRLESKGFFVTFSQGLKKNSNLRFRNVHGKQQPNGASLHR
jgi:hypothetical protein